ncbi:MAG: hypothetical protein IJW62_07460 [Clostridia bacterium]|nr:hypothetical protein [Clostridia bacterium]
MDGKEWKIRTKFQPLEKRRKRMFYLVEKRGENRRYGYDFLLQIKGSYFIILVSKRERNGENSH